MKVLDASTAVDALFHGPRQQQALAEMSTGDLIAPASIDAEVVSAIARGERAGRFERAQADSAIADWATIPVERFDLAPLVVGVWELRHYLWIKDAFYATLALSLDCPLLTSDARLARAGILGLDVRLIA